MKKIFLFFANIITLFTFSQDTLLYSKPKFKIEVQSGIMSYLGGLNNNEIKFTNNNIPTFKYGIRTDYKNIGAFLAITKGAYGQYQSSVKNKLNFKNNFIGVEFNLRYWIIKSKNISLYSGIGINYISVDSKTDLIDANGNKYNYWKDGTIRNVPENYDNIFTSSQTKRDYKYETPVSKEKILLFPISLGVQINLSEHFYCALNTSLYLSTTKSLNLIKTASRREYLLLNSISVCYVFISKAKPLPNKYDNIDFSSIMDIDSDMDGVLDINDNCQNTPKGSKVDKHGCLLDTDGDGVPDVKDKEPNTKKGLIVDLDGIGILFPTLKEVLENPPPEEIIE